MVRISLVVVFAVSAAVASSTRVLAQDRPITQAVKDAWITTQIQARFFADDLVKGRHINVDTTNGVVKLSGDVSSASERQRALTRAREVSGVTRVIDDLKVSQSPTGTAGKGAATAARSRDVKGSAASAADRLENEISDAWITTKVQSKFYLDSDVKGLQINVSTNGGVVTLAGRVENDAARAKALSIAKATEGVKQVIDKLVMEKT
jgi:hyperosmotically inducible periplasmic protein